MFIINSIVSLSRAKVRDTLLTLRCIVRDAIEHGMYIKVETTNRVFRLRTKLRDVVLALDPAGDTCKAHYSVRHEETEFPSCSIVDANTSNFALR